MKKIVLLLTGLFVLATIFAAGCIAPVEPDTNITPTTNPTPVSTDYSLIGTWKYSQADGEMVIDMENENTGKLSIYLEDNSYSAEEFGYSGYVKLLVQDITLEKTEKNKYLVTMTGAYIETSNGESNYYSDIGENFLGTITLQGDNYMVFDQDGTSSVFRKQ